MSNLITVLEGDETQTVPAEEINITNVKNIIYKNDNPHPVAIVAIAAVLIIFMYYIYVVFIKTCFNGYWLTEGEHGGDVVIRHNKWNDSLRINGVGSGFVKGGAIYLRVADEMHTGILYNNNIYWVGGAVWKRPV
jgi:hypothetical protein